MEKRATTTAALPRVLFVDDEQRVLNSMRIMFRRRFELFFASSGQVALDIVRDNDIDVIVADHRMPKMTGVEVLTAVRTLSPRTVRILLTGYADLDAIEGSINDGEVFRFLTKPCAPDQLRATLDLAVEASGSDGRTAPAPVIDPVEQLAHEILTEEPPELPSGPAAAALADFERTMTEQDLAETDVIDYAAMPVISPISQHRPEPGATEALDGGVVVFSADEKVIDSVRQAARGRFPIHVASNIVQVVKTLKDERPGVLLTDVTQDRNTIQTMTSRLKQHLPELVTIIVSEHRDALDMIWLINHGQIFRFLRKPVSPGRCAVSIQAALQHHEALRLNPILAARHTVDDTEDTGVLSGVFDTLKSVRRLWA